MPSWLCLAVLVSALPHVAAAAPPVLTLNDTNEPPYTTEDHTGFLDVVAGEAFRRAGVELRLVKLPAERGLLNADQGVDDGDLTRIAGLEQQYRNLIRVEEKLIDWEFAAFSRNTTIVAEWPVLRGLSVGHIKGWKIYETNLAGADRVTTVDDPAQLFRLLVLNRIEVGLYERWLGLALLKQLGTTDIRSLSPSLATREMFIYLNKRHAALASAIADALRALKREGFYARTYRATIAPYLGVPNQ
jgi:polar amino acid transport system substrate-binding protein